MFLVHISDEYFVTSFLSTHESRLYVKFNYKVFDIIPNSFLIDGYIWIVYFVSSICSELCCDFFFVPFNKFLIYEDHQFDVWSRQILSFFCCCWLVEGTMVTNLCGKEIIPNFRWQVWYYFMKLNETKISLPLTQPHSKKRKS